MGYIGCYFYVIVYKQIIDTNFIYDSLLSIVVVYSHFVC